ncbi:response regulator [Chitinophaga sp. SYP-B3965]|uniref:response regulator transcription factor n=1 Tax=Chitinophaga sp. SYP-B3965 TaxID=2663120 RepID=UPI00129995CE|nr:response regulator transcription factor [Chitinophaga sp. SYP-B3965]MRG45046.1 response regulator [Chitinophaga sp. SYP-B3965]
MAPRVLFAENDLPTVYVIKKVLEEEGYEVHIAYNGDAAWKLFNEMEFDICLFDILMPGLNGYELATEIRKSNTLLPIIYLSGVSDIIKGLKMGADDYILKPVNLAELILRMKVFLKLAGRATGKKVYTFGNYVLDMEKLVLTIGDTKVNLSMKEMRILSVLAKNIKNTVSRENIIQEVWNKSNAKIERPLYVFIHRIRKHLKADPRVEIETIRNEGYRLQVFDGLN